MSNVWRIQNKYITNPATGIKQFNILQQNQIATLAAMTKHIFLSTEAETAYTIHIPGS
jgi:hypothetical protein